MILKILTIRLKQLSRIIAELGIFRAIFLFGLICFGLLAMFLKLDEESYQEIIVGVIALSILSVHLKRKDKQFIKIHTPKPYAIFLTEYILLSLPLLIALIYYELWVFVLAYFLFLIAIPFIRISAKASSINSGLQKIIPDSNFEWKAGIRKNLILFVGVWFFGLITSFFVASVPIAIFILGVMVLSFYEKSESIQVLLANELSSGKFLAGKIRNHLIIFAVTIAPLFLSFIIFNPQYYYIPLIEFLIFVTLLVYTILLKYAFYQPHNKSGATGIFSMIGIICIFIPVFIPVVLLLSIKFLFQAVNNLNFYLNDFS